MKPAWDELMQEYKDHETTLIADVDCTAEGQSLCQSVGVRGYPTIKYGNPADLTDYEGGRTIDALKKFAKENLGPVCGPANMDLCDEEQTATIEKLMAMPEEELEEMIEEEERKIKE